MHGSARPSPNEEEEAIGAGRAMAQLEFQSLPDRHITTVKCTLGPLRTSESKKEERCSEAQSKAFLSLQTFKKGFFLNARVEIFKHPDRDS